MHMQHGHWNAARSWTCSMNMDIQHGHELQHAACFCHAACPCPWCMFKSWRHIFFVACQLLERYFVKCHTIRSIFVYRKIIWLKLLNWFFCFYIKTVLTVSFVLLWTFHNFELTGLAFLFNLILRYSWLILFFLLRSFHSLLLTWWAALWYLAILGWFQFVFLRSFHSLN